MIGNHPKQRAVAAAKALESAEIGSFSHSSSNTNGSNRTTASPRRLPISKMARRRKMSTSSSLFSKSIFPADLFQVCCPSAASSGRSTLLGRRRQRGLRRNVKRLSYAIRIFSLLVVLAVAFRKIKQKITHNEEDDASASFRRSLFMKVDDQYATNQKILAKRKDLLPNMGVDTDDNLQHGDLVEEDDQVDEVGDDDSAGDDGEESGDDDSSQFHPTHGKFETIELKNADTYSSANKIFHDSQQRSGLYVHLPFNYNRQGLYEELESPDHGGLELFLMEDKDTVRTIYHDWAEDETSFREPDQATDDDVDSYYAFDDDLVRGEAVAYDMSANDSLGLVVDNEKSCRRVSEHYLNFPNCNEFHQIDLMAPETNLKYINEGYFRQVFGMSHSLVKNKNQIGGRKKPIKHEPISEKFVIKDIQYTNDMMYDDYEYVRMDAIVAERLSSSPFIYDIYGFCGLGIMSEYFFHGDLEDITIGADEGDIEAKDLNDKDDVDPQNDLTGMQKLVLALQMAIGLQALHGNSNGLIIHDDIQLSQFLLNEDMSKLKLNDFNRAEFPLYDEEEEEYCGYRNGRGRGTWRSPEEYRDKPLTEKIDVWSLCNNIYAVLTGLNPFYDAESDSKIKDMIAKGEVGYIDERWWDHSPAEAKLAELIPLCWEYHPKDRISASEVVEFLNEAVNSLLEPGETMEAILQGIKL